MAQQNHVDLPNEFEALLREAMSSEPSAEFLSRVRQRVAGERPRAFPVWTVMSCTGAAAAVILLVALWPPATRPEPAVVPRPAPAMAAGERPPDPPVRPNVHVTPSRRHPPRVAAPRRTRESEVIVDRRQHAAIASVMRLVGEGKLTTESFAQTTSPSMQAIREQVPPVSVPAVQVSPIAVGGVLQMGTEK